MAVFYFYFHTPRLKSPLRGLCCVFPQRGGFYVECGAFDGERSSNTLYLERERGWTGLLVEMDPYFYTQLIGKSRHSWSINACLSPQPYVTQVQPLNSPVTSLSSLFTHTFASAWLKDVDVVLVQNEIPLERKPFYRAMHAVLARYCYIKSSVHPSVRLSVRLSVSDVEVPWAYRLD